MLKNIVYKCKNPHGSSEEKKYWESEIEWLLKKEDGWEGIIRGRGSSMFFIIGKSDRGNYICLPEWGIGSDLASLSDTFWNGERLQQKQLNTVDAITLAIGLGIIAKL